MAASIRYVNVAATGLFRWLADPADCPERRLLAELLAGDPRQPLDLEALARATGDTLAATGRLLFALNRELALEISTTPPALPAEPGLGDGLKQALLTLAAEGAAIVLAGDDGLLIAQAGTTAEIAEQIAAGQDSTHAFRQITTLHFPPNALVIRAAGELDLRHQAWVSIARQVQKSIAMLTQGETV